MCVCVGGRKTAIKIQIFEVAGNFPKVPCFVTHACAEGLCSCQVLLSVNLVFLKPFLDRCSSFSYTKNNFKGLVWGNCCWHLVILRSFFCSGGIIALIWKQRVLMWYIILDFCLLCSSFTKHLWGWMDFFNKRRAMKQSQVHKSPCDCIYKVLQNCASIAISLWVYLFVVTLYNSHLWKINSCIVCLTSNLEGQYRFIEP